MKSSYSSRLARYALLLFIVLTTIKCGMLVDKDRVVIANIGDRKITVGELRHAIGLMPADERPSISTRGDLRQALRDYLDREIKTMLADKLAEEGAIELPLETAAQYYFAQNPDIPDIRPVTDPSLLNLTTGYELQAVKDELSRNIERTRRRLLNEQAMNAYATTAANEGRLTITDEQWAREYDRNKGKLFNPARAKVRAIFVAAAAPAAQSDATKIRQRLEAGEAYDDIAAEITAQSKGAALARTLTNDGRSQRFAPFWQAALQSKAGAILGPVYIDGEAPRAPNAPPIPPTFMVCVLDRLFEPSEQSFEEAKQFLSPSLYYVEALKMLRQEHQVSIISENLPDPSISAAAIGTGGPIKRQDQQQQLPAQ